MHSRGITCRGIVSVPTLFIDNFVNNNSINTEGCPSKLQRNSSEAQVSSPVRDGVGTKTAVPVDEFAVEVAAVADK